MNASSASHTLVGIKNIVPKLNIKFSNKEIRDIAVESHIKKYKLHRHSDFKKIPSITCKQPI